MGELSADRTAAVTELFQMHYAQLVRLARFLVDDAETAEDVVMDAFVALHRRWSAIRTRTTPTATYVRACSTALAASCGGAGWCGCTRP